MLSRDVFGNAATFYSKQYGKIWGVDVLPAEDGWSTSTGTVRTFGKSVTMSLRLSDPSAVLEGSKTAALFENRIPYPGSQPYTCGPMYVSPDLSGRFCSASLAEQVYRSYNFLLDEAPKK